MYVETQLIVIHIDFETGTQKCLLQGGDLPSCSVSDSHPSSYCPTLLKELLEIETDWVTFVLVDVGFFNDTLITYYTCLIPSVVKNKHGSWQEIGRIEDGDVQKIVFEAGQRLLARH